MQESDDLQVEAEWRDAKVDLAHHGERLDRALVHAVPEFSRSYLQQLIDAGCVQVNANVVTKTSLTVKAGDALAIEMRPTPQSKAFKAEPLDLKVVYEDQHIFVINKPAGLVVHPAPGNWSGTLLNGLLFHDPKISEVPRAGIVHRLDKDTSGLMVVARSRKAMDALVQKNVTLQGSFSHNWPIWEKVIGLLSSGMLDVKPIIGGVWSISDWHEAFEKMHKGEVVKSILKPN